MEFKLSNINYPQLIPKYISNVELANEIERNIEFIEKYVEMIDTHFNEDKDRQLAYKQLGIMAFSCVEALWKSLVLNINKNCASRKCNEECKYRKYDSNYKLNNAKPRQVLLHLTNMRILYVHPFEEVAIEQLQRLRNHIHLTRVLADGNKSTKFNRQFVEDVLRLYYVSINQAEMNAWYYNEDKPCLRDMDDNSYNVNCQQQQSMRKSYYTDKTLLVLVDLFYKKPINENNAYFLASLSDDKILDIEYLADEMGKRLYYESAHYRTEVSYQEAIDRLYNAIQDYAPKSNLPEQIEDKMKYYHKFFNFE